MLTGRYPSAPQIIRLKAASGGFRWTILIGIITTLAFNSVLKALLKSSLSNTGCSTHDRKERFCEHYRLSRRFPCHWCYASGIHPCLESFATIAAGFDFTISQCKLVPPTRTSTFLGVELDTVPCSMALPQEKLYDCQTIVSNFLRKWHASKNQLQRLAGVQSCLRRT